MVTFPRVNGRPALLVGAAVACAIVLAMVLVWTVQRETDPSVQISADAPASTDHPEDAQQAAPEEPNLAEEVDVRLPDTHGADPRGDRVAAEPPPVEGTSPTTRRAKRPRRLNRAGRTAASGTRASA